MSGGITVLWFKRDLRIADHPALARAADLGRPVLALYIVEPGLWAEPDASGRQWDFVREALGDLAGALAGIGGKLVVQVGEAVEVLDALHRDHGIAHLVSHQETGTLWTYDRDRRVADWAKSAGVAWDEVQQTGVVRRLNTRDTWAAQRNRFMAREQVEVPSGLTWVDAPSDPWPDLGLLDHCPERQVGGRQQGLSLLGGFLTERGKTYRSAMSSPVEGEWACSRLSPYLAFGCLSGREVVQATAARQAEGPGRGWAGSLKSFQARLAWRDHFVQKLEDMPDLDRRNMHSGYDGLRGTDPERLRAWCAGETGVPFVDACMRYVSATGWLNFRMRSMLMAFASYHLWLDWRQTGLHLARVFTDYEPGIHWAQTQMQSGTTGINTLRIYNPVKQGGDQDPTGVFTRRWVPELAEVPDKYLQAPWGWEEAEGLAYPPPVVDVVEAAREARGRIWAVRRGPEFRAEADEVVRKHASRKDRHFVNDRAPRKRAAKRDGRQMDLGL
ncbi:FAD-binding domain-containing protein [Pseudaestuariivita atlantica]|uniref:Deoxyribodipyrimidine photolyase n=1 Tax=Pseudaestuariivita atlantica TaxID=1317121 RepID=A0A0L1JTK5_9RHOB|nr:FAD-binding domain-containing protein [Pseudaestuariivita atlantica]KNG95096.1 deoxyribodipyrimidine photolyase [Pseudaestuariivita atlantica]